MTGNDRISGKALDMKEADDVGKLMFCFAKKRKAASSVRVKSRGMRFDTTSRASFGADLNALVRSTEIWR